MIKKTGIYKISNKVDGKIYIGQAKDIEKRWEDHKKKTYPEDKFTYEILIECDIISLNFWEIAWITSENACHPDVGYNKSLGGTSIKVIFPSDETKNKISAALIGKKPTDEARALMSKNNARSKFCMVNGSCYTSSKEAASALGIKVKTLRSYLTSEVSWPAGMSGHYIDKKS